MDILYFELDQNALNELSITQKEVDAFKDWFQRKWGYELADNGICPEELEPGTPDDWVDSIFVDWFETNAYT